MLRVSRATACNGCTPHTSSSSHAPAEQSRVTLADLNLKVALDDFKAMVTRLEKRGQSHLGADA
eukprot:404769-Rhodomonas_salina.1